MATAIDIEMMKAHLALQGFEPRHRRNVGVVLWSEERRMELRRSLVAKKTYCTVSEYHSVETPDLAVWERGPTMDDLGGEFIALAFVRAMEPYDET